MSRPKSGAELKCERWYLRELSALSASPHRSRVASSTPLSLSDKVSADMAARDGVSVVPATRSEAQPNGRRGGQHSPFHGRGTRRWRCAAASTTRDEMKAEGAAGTLLPRGIHSRR